MTDFDFNIYTIQSGAVKILLKGLGKFIKKNINITINEEEIRINHKIDNNFFIKLLLEASKFEKFICNKKCNFQVNLELLNKIFKSCDNYDILKISKINNQNNLKIEFGHCNSNSDLYEIPIILNEQKNYNNNNLTNFNYCCTIANNLIKKKLNNFKDSVLKELNFNFYKDINDQKYKLNIKNIDGNFNYQTIFQEENEKNENNYNEFNWIENPSNQNPLNLILNFKNFYNIIYFTNLCTYSYFYAFKDNLYVKLHVASLGILIFYFN